MPLNQNAKLVTLLPLVFLQLVLTEISVVKLIIDEEISTYPYLQSKLNIIPRIIHCLAKAT